MIIIIIMIKFNHPYHLVTLRPWPLISSLRLIILIRRILIIFFISKINLLIFALISLTLNLYQWWRDIIRERTIQGFHTLIVSKGLQNGIIIFILSEIIFFLSFFWCYFHIYLSPRIDIGRIWYPQNLIIFNPYNIPLLNTLILLSSGISITYCHYRIIESNQKKSYYRLIITIYLGIIFSLFQYIEYNESFFCINDSTFGSIFFILTGFHGFHVILGTTFNLITFFRLKYKHLSSFHFFGFEASSWYWHFVDLIWLFLYTIIYWLIY